MANAFQEMSAALLPGTRLGILKKGGHFGLARVPGWPENHTMQIDLSAPSTSNLGDPPFVILDKTINSGLVKAFSGFRCRQGRIGADASVRKITPIVGSVGEFAARGDWWIEQSPFDRLGVGELGNGNLARGSMAALGVAV